MKKILTRVPRWLPAFLMMAAIFYFSSQPSEKLPNFATWDRIFKKGGHMMGYGLLALSYLHGLRYNKKYYWLAWLLAVLYAATDEFHQSFVAGRGASIFDVIVFDNLGAAFMLWLNHSELGQIAARVFGQVIHRQPDGLWRDEHEK